MNENKKLPVEPSMQQYAIDNFNRAYNVGDKVIVIDDYGKEFEDVIKYPASIMGGHTPMAWLKGKGAYMLTRVIRRA